MMNVRYLCAYLAKMIDDVTVQECRNYLDNLHALGKLWLVRDEKGSAIAKTVILSPKRVLRSLNEIIEVAQADGVVEHASLKERAIWAELDEDEMLQLKCFFQHLKLVYPATQGAMVADSDMVVHACWNNDTVGKRPPLNKQETLLKDAGIGRKSTVCWEYEVPVDVSETAFTQFAFVSRGHGERNVRLRFNFQDIATRDSVAVASLVSGVKTIDVIRIEVAADDYLVAWRRLKPYVAAMETVLREYPGLAVARYTVDSSSDYGRHTIEDVIVQLDVENRSGKENSREDKPWLPPRGWIDDWKSMTVTNQWRKQDRDDDVRKRLGAIHNSVIADSTLRLFPAVWTLKYNDIDKRVEVRMLSDYSYACFHEQEPIELDVPPAFLAQYGPKLQVGLSFLSNVAPDFVSLNLLQPYVDAMVSTATTVHNMMQDLDLYSGQVFSSTDEKMTPAEAVLLLQDLLRLRDADFHPLMISKMSGLEPAVNLDGHFVWASREEIADSAGTRKLTPCSVGRTEPPPSGGTSAATPSSSTNYKLVIGEISGLDDLSEIFCEWELTDGSSVSIKGESSKPTEDDDPLATGSVPPFDLQGIQSDDELCKYHLVVRVKKKPSSLRRKMLRCSQRLQSLLKSTVIGEGEANKLTVDDEISIPVRNTKTKTQVVATITCRIKSN